MDILFANLNEKRFHDQWKFKFSKFIAKISKLVEKTDVVNMDVLKFIAMQLQEIHHLV